MLKRNNMIWLILACVMLFFLSYIRESFFLTLNGVIRNQPEINSYFNWFYMLFNSMSINTLLLLKWISTIVFSIFFVSATLFFIYKYFSNRNYIKVLTYVYAVTVAFILIFGLIGVLLGKYQQFYVIIRFLAGIIQSPLIFFFAIPVFSFIGSFNKK